MSYTKQTTLSTIKALFLNRNLSQFREEVLLENHYCCFTLGWTAGRVTNFHFSFSEHFPYSHEGDFYSSRVSRIFLLFRLQIAAWIILSDLDWWLMKIVLSFLFQEKLSLKCLAFKQIFARLHIFSFLSSTLRLAREGN